eukprot:594253_1
MNEFVRFSNIFLLQSTFCMFFNGSVIIRLNDEYDTQHYTVNVRCDTMHLLHVNLNSIDPCGCDSRCLLGLIIQMTIEVSYDPLCTFTSHLSIIKCDVQCNAYIDLSDHVQCMYSEGMCVYQGCDHSEYHYSYLVFGYKKVEKLAPPSTKRSNSTNQEHT